jgi:predicted SAM-dependent methyltransferase
MDKLNLAAGRDIRSNYINHDIVKLSGIDIVHDLNQFPWPWKDNSFEEVIAIDILEHLEDFVGAIEELYRILKPGAIVTIRVPYWNHSCAYIDPTHKRGYHEDTFHFFDKDSIYYKDRDYYSKVTFKIVDEVFLLTPGSPYFTIPKVGIIYVRIKVIRKIVGWIGNHIGNIIAGIQVSMKKI